MDDSTFEAAHDFIQWLFPLKTPSAFNESCETFTDESLEIFQTDPVIRANMIKSMHRYLKFLGLVLTGKNGQLRCDRGPNFRHRFNNKNKIGTGWGVINCAQGNHNW